MTDEERLAIHERARERALTLITKLSDPENDFGVFDIVLMLAYAHVGTAVSVIQNSSYTNEERALMIDGEEEMSARARREILEWLRNTGRIIEAS
jgi:hypothetical protein